MSFAPRIEFEFLKPCFCFLLLQSNLTNWDKIYEYIEIWRHFPVGEDHGHYHRRFQHQSQDDPNLVAMPFMSNIAIKPGLEGYAMSRKCNLFFIMLEKCRCVDIQPARVAGFRFLCDKVILGIFKSMFFSFLQWCSRILQTETKYTNSTYIGFDNGILGFKALKAIHGSQRTIVHIYY